MGWAGGIYNADMVQAGNGYIIFIYAFRVSAMEIHHRRMVTATVKRNTMKHVFMGVAGILLNADMIQAGGSYMTLIHAFLVSAVEIHHVRVVAAAVERNRVQYVFIGAAGIQLNADVVQAGRRYMTFIHVFLVSAVGIHHVGVVMAVVDSNNVQLVFMGAAGMIVNVDVVQAGSGFRTFIHAFLVSAVTIHHVGVVTAVVEHQEIGEEKIIHYNHSYMFYVGC